LAGARTRTEAELVSKVQRGSREAFNLLVRRIHAGLFRFVRTVVGEEEEARDVTQEALLRAYLRIGSLRDPRRFRPWLRSIALNLCRDRRRGWNGRRIPLQALDPPAVEPQHGDPRLRDAVRVALGRIPPEQRVAILLREYHGFSTREVAEATGVPEATVRTRIFYGLRALRRHLEEMGYLGVRGGAEARKGGVNQ
jgi:RNA polymerase sigma-70 factor (ECF subfamily)